ncbi:hypothetical protein OEZ85_011643 [Tetradesmus obliquus]|uniref:Plastid lipid-associated protein/fibrillin conserved domain-containing protein n=1 Tax=Tetradesmus obliquus TaxID=3088 RepID=A0ABY8TRA3_TETOB|nr:hypothetical protein OEZ85_011643 [Tetradesmus obliquus]
MRSSECSTLIPQLVTSTEGQKFGAASTEQQRSQVLQLAQQLKQEQAAAPDSSSSSSSDGPTAGALSGSWRLLWTTEASVHALVKGQLLGIGVRDIQQHIDLPGKRVTNTIAFALLGLQLQASGPLTVLNSTRIYYSFDKLLLRLLGLQLSLPLFIKGGGWTDCVALQQGIRVMENSRRDTLVLQGLPE